MITSESFGDIFRPDDRVRLIDGAPVPAHLEPYREYVVGRVVIGNRRDITIRLDESIPYQGKRLRQVSIDVDSLERE